MAVRPLSAVEIIQNAQRKIVADIQENVKRTEQLSKFVEDYARLDTTLSTLPDRVSHPMMVPLGPMAFMPGQAVHTNEVFVLLGENYFVERSAKQAREIIERRLSVLKEEMKSLNEEYESMRARLGMTEEMQQGQEELGTGNIVDIREEYHSDEDEEEAEVVKRIVPPPAAPQVARTQTVADDAEEERRMERLMQLLALEEAEEQREASVVTPIPEPQKAPEPHGTKRPKPALKGDTLKHANKTVRIMAPGETEALPPVKGAPTTSLPSSSLSFPADMSDVVSFTVLGGGVGPAHTIQFQPDHRFGSLPTPTTTQAPLPLPTPMPTPTIIQTSDPIPTRMQPPMPTTSTTTTHKRAFSDSPVAERRGSFPETSFSSISTPAPSRPFGAAAAVPAVVERPSVPGSAFSGAIIEREPLPPAQASDSDEAAQPPKKMSRFRAMRAGGDASSSSGSSSS